MPKRRRRIAAVVGIALGVYVLLAALPYARRIGTAQAYAGGARIRLV